MREWFATAAGNQVTKWLEAKLPHFLAEQVGFYAIHLGVLPFEPLAAARVRWRWSVAPDAGEIRAEWEQLPFASNAIDCVLASFVWSLARDPFAVLREIDRVLVPEGRLYWVAFNPWSPWRLTGRIPPFPTLSVPRLRDHLRVLGFETRLGRFGVYAPLGPSSRWGARWESIGDRWFPALGSVYLVEAIKRVAGVRLIEPNWRQQLHLRATRLAGARPASLNHWTHDDE
ncbi:methyltransferase domain-containing protein [Hydrogenophilus islandicus]